MPNHVHGIIIIEKPYNGFNGPLIDECNSTSRDVQNAISHRDAKFCILQRPKNNPY
jgi:hypothetical protein